MKIALIGAQGVGKTTLAKRLHMAIPNSHIIKETVRECPFPCDQAADFKTEWWVLSHSILEEKIAEESGFDLLIADRCLLDISVYTKLIAETGDGRITAGKQAMIDLAIAQWLKESPYDLMFFVKVDAEIWEKRDIDDGFRSTDMGWYLTLTSRFEEAISRLEANKNSKLIEIYNNGKIEEPLNKILGEMSALGDALKKKPEIIEPHPASKATDDHSSVGL